MITRRAALASTAALASAAGFHATPARAAGQLVVGTFGGDYSALLISEMEQRLMPPLGIDVVQTIGVNTERKTKLIAERSSRRGSMDVAHLGDTDMSQIAQLGLLEPLDMGAIPNAAHILPPLRLPYAVPHIYSAQVVLYNPDHVNPAPKSFADLWDAKYRGRIGIADGNATAITFAAALAGGGSMHDWEPGKKKLLELRSLDAQIYNSNEALAQAWKADEVWIAPMWLARGFMWKKAGLNIAHVVPSEGALPVVFQAAVPKNARNKADAWAYLNGMLDAKAQVGFADRMGYVPTVDNADLPPDLAAQIGFTPEDQAGFKGYDYDYVNRNIAALQGFWDKEFKA